MSGGSYDYLGRVECQESARLLRWSAIEGKPRPVFVASATMSAQVAAFLNEQREEWDFFIGHDRRGQSITLMCRDWAPLRSRRAADGRLVTLPDDERPYYTWREWWGVELLGLSRPDATRLSFWEADHIVPVAEGGWRLGLENFLTLCLWCHRKKSADDVRRIRARRA